MTEIEAINVRTTRINHLILGRSEATSKVKKSVAEALSREGLLDALCLLYNECNKDFLKKKDRNIFDFVTKYRDVIKETNSLRVNIDDFCVKSLIGLGYFGEVHLATEKSTKDVYAIKKIRKSLTVTSAQVKEERDIMSYKSCEWITSLQYAFQDTDYLYLVMEYLPGGDLLSLMIRQGAFDEDLCRFYMAEMTLALNTLHTLGYVHRDVKPENILLDRFGHLKLADFGNVAPLNKHGNVISLSPVGTPNYIAPELLETLSSMSSSKSVHDVTCDFWSMGVIGYEFLTETTPFYNENVHETYSNILGHVSDTSVPPLEYPDGVEVSKDFRNLIDQLVTRHSKRFGYHQIVQHPFFEGVGWDTLRHQVPPIIPSLSGDDDTSNFEDVDKKGRRSTYTKSKSTGFAKGNDFSGQNLPFIGYSYINEMTTGGEFVTTGAKTTPASKEVQQKSTTKLTAKIAELQATIDENTVHIKKIQHQLLSAQQKCARTELLEKILHEAKNELTDMKDKLKEKTVELAACKTDNKTLKSSLKIEEEMRLKNDTNISEVLNSTYQKWEKAKKAAEQNYEKQIAERKTEIACLTQNLQARENELSAKVDECKHLQERVHNYKELLKSSKEQNTVDKGDYETNKSQLIESYESKINELKGRVQQEKQAKVKAANELRDMRNDLNESICSTKSISQSKLTTERNMDEMKSRLSKQIEENAQIREEKANGERKIVELEKRCEEVAKDLERLQKLHSEYEEAMAAASRRSSCAGVGSELFRSAQGSLESITSGVEEQLRNDLVAAKESEHLQRNRAERLEEAVARLEDAIGRLQPQPVDNILERKNEKLEDQLASVREQAIVERQASRTAHLSLYKLEKQIEDFNLEKKLSARRLELVEDKFHKVRSEKDEIERQLRDNQSVIKAKEERVAELQQQIADLKVDLKKEHSMWEKAEHERMKDKSEIIEHVSRIHQLEERQNELKRKLSSAETRNGTVTLENQRLLKEKSQDHEHISRTEDTVNELETELASVQRNYDMLKVACTIMETQLNELEEMYESETRQNRINCDKNDQLWTQIRARDADIATLRQQLDEQSSLKIDALSKCTQLQADIVQLKESLEAQRQQWLSQQDDLMGKTTSLFQAQESIEVLTADLSNLHRINENYSRELHILKEENTKVLTELFLIKEEANNLSMDRKELRQQLVELQKEMEQLNGTLSEQKNYYLHRDIKAEATEAQYKKLISYLQQRVAELSIKKKKSLADVLFGNSSSSSKKENLPPNVSAIEDSASFKRLQDDLRKERARSDQLKEQLLKAKTEMRTKAAAELIPAAAVVEDCRQVEYAAIQPAVDVVTQPSKRSSPKRHTQQTHHFEMTLENNSVDYPYTACLVCQKQIMVGHPYLKCKECKCAVHRRCRGDVNGSCTGVELAQIANATEQSTGSESESSYETGSSDVYAGDLVFRTSDLSPPLRVHCVHQITEDILLLGAESGLYSFHQSTKQLVHITGIVCVTFIAVNVVLSKCVLVGAQGEHLYLCDLRHLQSRAQASACLKPKLDTTVLELPFANRVSSERWHYVAIDGSTGGSSSGEAHIIACTSSRLVILRFDIGQNRLKPMCALDTAKPVTCVLFTPHSAIVASDKFFEIDLRTFQAEEFLDESDMSSIEARTSCRPMAVYKINSQEFLLCFEEFGIFVDNYGDRSRPDNVNWANPPTGFVYRDPLLFVAYRNMLEVVRINKSYTAECERKMQENDAVNEVRSFITVNEPRLCGDCGQLGVFVLVKEMGGGGGVSGEQLLVVEGVKSLKSFMSNSLETLLSSRMAGSSETISTINRLSDSS